MSQDVNQNIKDLLTGKVTFDAIKSGKVPIDNPKVGDRLKLSYLHNLEDESEMFKAPQEAIDLFVQYCDELCEKNNYEAMKVKAFCMYGGCRAYENDWYATRDLMEKILEDTGDPHIANSLGYIYYYGRCSEGKRDYDKAFYYFSIGAADGIFESKYKIADMFLHGRGVPQNKVIAATTILNLYIENLDIFRAGEYLGKFADLALRLSNPEIEYVLWQLTNDGIDADNAESELDDEVQDPDYPKIIYDACYYHLLEAKYALELRMKTADLYGDDNVAKSIVEQMDKIYPKTSFYKDINKAVFAYFSSIDFAMESLLGDFVWSQDPIYQVNFYENEASCYFTVRSLKYLEQNYLSMLLVKPEFDLCKLVKEITFIVEGTSLDEIKLVHYEQDGKEKFSTRIEEGKNYIVNDWDNNYLESFENNCKIVIPENRNLIVNLEEEGN